MRQAIRRRVRHQSRVDLLTPRWRDGHGTGSRTDQHRRASARWVGFIDKTGACQYRDSRITTIYEGTTGIQANDLIGRKLPAKKSPARREISTADMEATVGEFGDHPDLRAIADRRRDAIGPLAEAAAWVPRQLRRQATAAAAGAVPFLKLTGNRHRVAG